MPNPHASPPLETSSLSPGIEATPGICGGAARIAGTRIAVWILEDARASGATDEELLADYPSLGLQYLRNARAYAEAYRAEIARQIHENEVA